MLSRMINKPFIIFGHLVATLNVCANFKKEAEVKRHSPSNPCFREKLRLKARCCWELLGENHLQQPALSASLTSTCYNQTQQQLIVIQEVADRPQLRVAAERVDLTTQWMGHRNDCLSSEWFINLLNKAGSRTPWLPLQVSKERNLSQHVSIK